MSFRRLASQLSSAENVEWAGRVTVALQFGLLAIMGSRAWLSSHSIDLLASSLLSGSALLAVWAVAANRPGNFNIRPVPRSGGTLVTSGPYRWIRHPMYTSVLMAAAAAAVKSHQAADGGLWLGLLAVLLIKAAIEERALLMHYPHYQGYQARTGKFLPRLVRPSSRAGPS